MTTITQYSRRWMMMGRKKRAESVSTRRVLAAAVLLGLAASPVAAQNKVEISGHFGHTFAEGVNVSRGTLVNEFIDAIGVGDGISYGGSISVWADDRVQLGFQFDLQESALRAEGSASGLVTDMKVYGYHGIGTVHGGSSSSTVRPFVLLGLGATQYKPSDLNGVSFDGETKFSGTLGVGAKAYLSERIGLSFTGRWTPTYIKSDSAGLYCSPYWDPWYGGGCVAMADPDYSNQFALTGGIILRF